MQKEKIIVVGSGPAGLTAGLYTARARLEPLVITGNQLGGQMKLRIIPDSLMAQPVLNLWS